MPLQETTDKLNTAESKLKKRNGNSLKKRNEGKKGKNKNPETHVSVVAENNSIIWWQFQIQLKYRSPITVQFGRPPPQVIRIEVLTSNSIRIGNIFRRIHILTKKMCVFIQINIFLRYISFIHFLWQNCFDTSFWSKKYHQIWKKIKWWKKLIKGKEQLETIHRNKKREIFNEPGLLLIWLTRNRK